MYSANGVSTRATVDADGVLVNLGTNNDVTVTTLPALVAGSANIGDVDVASIAAGDNNIGNVDVVSLPALVAGTANIGDVDVLTLPSIPAGTNNIGDVDILTIAAGDNNIGNVDVVTLPALPAGNNNIGDVDIASSIPGTGATNLGKAVDGVAGATDTGVLALAVRDDSLATLTPADADYTQLRTTSQGRLWTSAVIDTALPAGTANIGDVDVASIAAGDNNIGNVDLASAIPAGTALIGGVNVRPGTTGGLSIHKSIDLDESEEEVKGTAGQVFGWFLKNRSAAEVFIKFYNATAANVTVGSTTPVFTLSLESKQAANVEFTNGIAFSTAICVAATTGFADGDSGAPAANDVIATILYA
jgi:hypothetical protein